MAITRERNGMQLLSVQITDETMSGVTNYICQFKFHDIFLLTLVQTGELLTFSAAGGTGSCVFYIDQKLATTSR